MQNLNKLVSGKESAKLLTREDKKFDCISIVCIKTVGGIDCYYLQTKLWDEFSPLAGNGTQRHRKTELSWIICLSWVETVMLFFIVVRYEKQLTPSVPDSKQGPIFLGLCYC